MTVDLGTIVFGVGLALVYAALLPATLRGWALMLASVIAIFWLQPETRVPRLDFIFQTGTLALVVAGWWWTRPRTQPKPDTDPALSPSPDALGSIARPFAGLNLRLLYNENLLALLLIAGVVLAISGTRFLDADYRLTTRPPEPAHVALVLTGLGMGAAGVARLLRSSEAGQRRLLNGAILLVIGLFVILKTEVIAVEISRALREAIGRDPTLASVLDLEWLGFSYVAFRLIHTFRDRQTGRLPDLSLREYVTYVVFFPAYIAGPIDRAERFVKDFRALPQMTGLDAARFNEGMTRIMVGVFKKFVIADSLAQGAALNSVNADQAESPVGLWLLLYGYALRLFFDFSGYSDIAIGLGILFGIKLPENFDRPYLKTNITAFWQSWHITLSNWARFYVFTPFSRTLMTRPRKPPTWVIVLAAQATTMVVIGLWHGVTLNFLIWGLWHGAGLFIHKQWSDRTRKWYRGLKEQPARLRAWSVAGWFITFHYVVIGWVWFALPQTEQSVRVLAGLFGFAL